MEMRGIEYLSLTMSYLQKKGDFMILKRNIK